MTVRPPLADPRGAEGPAGPPMSGGVFHAPPRRRPYGVAVIAVISGVLGFAGVVLGLLALLNPLADLGPASQMVGYVSTRVIPLTTLVAAGLALVGILVYSVARGLWRGERWSWMMGIGLVFLAEAVLFFYLVPFTYLFFLLLVVFVYLIAVRDWFV